MRTFITLLTLAAIVGQPMLVFADDLKPGDRVEGTATFFMCGARDDLDTIRALDRIGDKATAIKVGTERCESGRPGYRYVLVRAEGDALCIRPDGIRDGIFYCLWARRSSLQIPPSQ